MMQSEARVTVAIPTCNRAELLRSGLKSVLEQDYPSFRVLVLDNASSDHTEAVVKSFGDPRLCHVRNENNIGLFRNWNRAIELNSSPYLTILQDDDGLLPGFISESAGALDAHSSAGFSFVQTTCVDANGSALNGIDASHVSDPTPEGLMKGSEYLHRIVAGRKMIIRSSGVMMRSAAIEAVGPFDAPHSYRSMDLNLYLRLAAKFDMVSIKAELAVSRFHEEQDSQSHYHASGGTGALATMAERMDAVAHLLRSERADDAAYRQWLAERLSFMSMVRSQLTAELLPDLNLGWSERIDLASREITSLVPAGESFILVDEAALPTESLGDRHAIPFLEREGEYWGAPSDDATAIRELERGRQAGAKQIVIAWPAFWWLDYYAGLREHLYSRYPVLRSNSRIIAFRL